MLILQFHLDHHFRHPAQISNDSAEPGDLSTMMRTSYHRSGSSDRSPIKDLKKLRGYNVANVGIC